MDLSNLWGSSNWDGGGGDSFWQSINSGGYNPEVSAPAQQAYSAPTPSQTYTAPTTPAPASVFTEAPIVSQPAIPYSDVGVSGGGSTAGVQNTFTPPIANYQPWDPLYSAPGDYTTYNPDQWMSMTAQQRDVAKSNMSLEQATSILSQLSQAQKQVLYDQNQAAGIGDPKFLGSLYDSSGNPWGGQVSYMPEYGGSYGINKDANSWQQLYTTPTGYADSLKPTYISAAERANNIGGVQTPIRSGSTNTNNNPTNNSSNYLTMDQLQAWWNNTNNNNNTGLANTLSTLFPRLSWANYQSNERGKRYFDRTTGKYTGLGNITQQNSL